MAVVGNATVVVRASVAQMREDLRKGYIQAAKDADAAGALAGNRYAQAFARGSTGVDIDLDDKANDSGNSASDRFNDAFLANIATLRETVVLNLDNAGRKAGVDAGREIGRGIGSSRADIDNQLTRIGSSGGNSLRSAIERSVKGLNVDLPSFRGRFARIGLQLLAILPAIGVVIGALGSLGGALIGLAGVAGQAAGALAVIPGILGGIAALAISGVVAFGGFGAAFKELGTSAASAGKSAVNNAKQQEAAARAIENAERSLRDSKENLADAERNLQKARQSAGRAGQQVQRDNARAARDVADAERDLRDAQVDVIGAQRDLNRAREEAAEGLEDLQLNLRGAVLGEAEAQIRLNKARQDYQQTLSSSVDPNDRAQALIDLQQAELALDQARDRREDITKEAQDANRVGVEGSQQVVSAKEAIISAERAEADAARNVADARQEQRDTAVDGARAIQDAVEGVTDAQRALRDAQQAVRDNTIDLARAQRDAKTGADALSAGLGNQMKAFNKLSPEAQRFAIFLDSLRPKFAELRREAGRELFPKLEEAIQGLLDNGFFDLLKVVLRDAGSALGDFALTLSKAFGSDAFQESFGAFFKGFFTGVKDVNGEMQASPAQNFFEAIALLAVGFAGLAEASLPLIDRFSKFTKAVALGFANKTTGDTENLTNTLNGAGDAVSRLFDFFKALGGSIKLVFSAATPLGNELLRLMTNGLEKFNALNSTPEGKKGLQDFFLSLLPNIKAAGRFIASLIGLFIDLANNPDVGRTFDTLTDAVKKSKDIFDSFIKIAPDIIEFFESLFATLSDIADSGAFQIFLNVLTGAFNTLQTIFNFPFVKNGLFLLLGLAAGFKALSLFTKFTGLQALFKLFAKGIFLKGDDAGAIRKFTNGLFGLRKESTDLASVIGNSLNRQLNSLRFDKIDNIDVDRIRAARISIKEMSDTLGKLDVSRLRELENLNDADVEAIEKAIADVQLELRGARNGVDEFGAGIRRLDVDSISRVGESVDRLGLELDGIDNSSIQRVLRDLDNLDSELNDIRAIQLPAPDTAESRRNGARAVELFGEGAEGAVGGIRTVFDKIAETVSDRLRQRSPAKLGPLSEGGGTAGWGRDAGLLFADGLSDSSTALKNVADEFADIVNRELKDIDIDIDKSDIKREFENALGDDLKIDKKIIINEDVVVNKDTKGRKDANDGDGIKGRGKDAGGDVGSSIISDFTSGNITSIQDLGASAASAFTDTFQDSAQEGLTGAGAAVLGKFGSEAGDAAEDAGNKAGGRFGKIVGKFGTVAGRLGTAARGIGLAVTTALGPVGLIIIAVAAFAAGLVLLYKKSETFRKIVQGAINAVGKVFDKLKDIVGKVFKVLKDNFDKFKVVLLVLLGPIGLIIAAFMNFDKVKKVVKVVVDTVKDLLGGLVNFVKGIPGKITSALSAVWDVLKDKFNDAKKFVTDGFNSILNFVKAYPGNVKRNLAAVWDILKDKFTAAKKFVVDGFNSVLDFLGSIPGRVVGRLTNMFNVVKDKLTDAKNFVVNTFGNILEFIGGIPGRIAGRLSNAFGGLKDAITSAKNFVSDKFGEIIGFVTGLPGKIRAGIGAIKDAALGLGKGIFDGIKQGLTGIIGGGVSLVTAILRGFQDLLNTFIIDKINDAIPDDIGFTVKGFGISKRVAIPLPDTPLPRINFLAQGGTVLPQPGGTLAVLAEAGRAETVVDTGLLNKRLAMDIRGGSSNGIIAELRAMRRELEAMRGLNGLTIENLNATAGPGEDTSTSVPRALRSLAFELGV